MSTKKLRDTYGRTVIRILNSGLVPNYDDPEEKTTMFGAAGSGVWCKPPEPNNLAEDDMAFVTNAHVIDNAAKLFVNHPEWGTLKLPAQAVGGYRDGDKALLVVRGINQMIQKLEKNQNKFAADLSEWFQNVQKIGPLPFWTREKLSDVVDSPCFVVGFPLNQANQVITRGVVSSIQLFDTGDRGQILLFQTDAAMNHGNSGGAMVVQEGEGKDARFYYAGIPSMGIPTAENTGYVLPFHHVESLIYGFTQNEESFLKVQNQNLGTFLNCEKPYLGFNAVFQPGDQDGYLVTAIDQSNSPFDLLEGDLIIKVGDAQVEDGGMLQLSWTDLRIPFETAFEELDLSQETASLTVIRQETLIESEGEFKLDVNLPIRRLYGGIEPFQYESFAGLVISELNLDQVEDIPILFPFAARANRTKPRLAVVAVDPLVNSTIKRGWLVTQVNGNDVQTYEQWKTLFLASIDENTLSITFNDVSGYSLTLNIPNLENVIQQTVNLSKIRNERITEGVEDARFKKAFDSCISMNSGLDDMEFKPMIS